MGRRYQKLFNTVMKDAGYELIQKKNHTHPFEILRKIIKEFYLNNNLRL